MGSWWLCSVAGNWLARRYWSYPTFSLRSTWKDSPRRRSSCTSIPWSWTRALQTLAELHLPLQKVIVPKYSCFGPEPRRGDFFLRNPVILRSQAKQTICQVHILTKLQVGRRIRLLSWFSSSKHLLYSSLHQWAHQDHYLGTWGYLSLRWWYSRLSLCRCWS